MLAVYEKVIPSIVKKNRDFFKSRVKKSFVSWLAYKGMLDGVLSPREIELARKGILPEDLNIHHKMPLSGSAREDVNDFSNLTVIHKKTHEFINKYVFSPQLKKLDKKPFGTKICIEIPEYDFVDKDGILKERLLARQRYMQRNRLTNSR